MEQPRAAGPLAGVTVLDLSRFIAGPLCAQTLGDLGADVVKVERPAGEDARHHAPYVDGHSLYPMLYNRNKRGLTLDTRHPDAVPVLEDLVRWADVVVENYRPGTLDAMGLGYARLTELNPDVVLVSVSGFGQTGPDSKRALFDAIAQASSGLMSITGEPDGPPMLTGTYVADYVTGMQAAIGALAAVMHRERTGEGQHVDVASLDSTFGILGTRLIAHLMLGLEMPRTGARDLLTAPVNVYRCRDASLYIQAGTDSLFARLCAAIARPDLAADPRFATVEGRMAAQDHLETAVAAWVVDLSADDATAALDAAGVPCAKVASIAEVAGSQQIRARGMVETVVHPVVGELRLPASPLRMSRVSTSVRTPPPLVGEHTAEVLQEVLGLSASAVERLRASGVV